MSTKKHYLEQELYDLIRNNDYIFDFLQEGSLDGIWYWDIEKPENEWMSPRFWTNFGYDPSEKKHLSAEWQDMIFKDDLIIATENFKKHCEDPKYPYDQIVRYRKKDGSTAWVRCRGIAIRDENGKPIRMIGAHNDISDIKKTEQELVIKNKIIEKNNLELKKFNTLMIGREITMMELKKEVDSLLQELGRKPKYK